MASYGDSKKFNGLVYRKIGSRKTKTEARAAVKTLKSTGKKARRIKSKWGYDIYVRG